MLTGVAFILATVFVFVACSAPEGQTAAIEYCATISRGRLEGGRTGARKAGSMQPGDVYKVSCRGATCRSQLAVCTFKPALALGSWIAFKKMGETAMVMGDLVLTEDEVTPCHDKSFRRAVSNRPRSIITYYMSLRE